MSECESIRDRMPEVLHARAAWSEAEGTHLAGCSSCAEEWRLVQDGAALFRDASVDVDAISRRLRARMASEGGGALVRQIPWGDRRLALGFLAVAASLALLVGVTPRPHSARPGVAPAVVAGVLPELDGLSESQLEAVLSGQDLRDESVSPMRLPRLGDLSESELEEVLRDLEG